MKIWLKGGMIGAVVVIILWLIALLVLWPSGGINDHASGIGFLIFAFFGFIAVVVVSVVSALISRFVRRKKN